MRLREHPLRRRASKESPPRFPAKRPFTIFRRIDSGNADTNDRLETNFHSRRSVHTTLRFHHRYATWNYHSLG